MTDLAKEELSTKNIVKVENKNWNWSNDTRKEPRFAILTVDKAQAEGTVITLDGLTSLMDNNQDMFQVTPNTVGYIPPTARTSKVNNNSSLPPTVSIIC